MAKADPVFRKLQIEVGQGHELRVPLYKAIEDELGQDKPVRVVSFFTSFRFPVLIEDDDATMLEELLATTDLDGRELLLLINSPGGDALAAERIVNVCKSYSKDGFRVIVPSMAKSAATMICLGADEILLSNTSELGPIDPQILIHDDNGQPSRYQAAHEILESYTDLLDKAVATKGRIEPFLQQLARFDARDIRRICSAQDLSSSIATNLLKRGMLNKKTVPQIRRIIRPLTDPKQTKDHGRPVFYPEAKACGLNVRLVENRSSAWRKVWELYLRLNYLTLTSTMKVLETIDESYVSSVAK